MGGQTIKFRVKINGNAGRVDSKRKRMGRSRGPTRSLLTRTLPQTLPQTRSELDKVRGKVFGKGAAIRAWHFRLL
jgi:hypothetical protein